MDTLKEILNVFIGSYESITYTDYNGISRVADGFAGVDWCWIFSAVLLVLGVYSIFRVLGIIISKF